VTPSSRPFGPLGGDADFIGADLGAGDVPAHRRTGARHGGARPRRGGQHRVHHRLIGGDKSALYSSTKAAVHSLAKSWAAEYGPSGVRVNAVAPGPIATERAADVADHRAPVLARIPSRRMSTPEEVAAAVVFLASDDAANIHGAVLSVDGGWAAV
jgi:NAD(P)-dependent dehydrogenase (short-subunit alcohol dehydrogenase family)